MTSTRTPGAFNVGDSIDARYKLTRDLGQGAAGRVFEAVHLFTGRSVALKIVIPDVAPDLRAELNARLAREARALASVRHPGVVDILDGGFVAGSPYIVMEMLEGRTFEGLIATRGRLTVEDTIAGAWQLAGAIEAAHAVGVVHRDVKPSNAMVTQTPAGHEVVKLVDFGVARIGVAKVNAGDETDKLTGVGTIVGTPAYMAPEQLLGLEDDGYQGDVYALGVTMFECLTGSLPYTGSYQRVILTVCSAAPVPRLEAREKTVPAGVSAVVSRAMAKERSDRYASMTEFRKALEATLGEFRKETHVFGPPRASTPTSARTDTSSVIQRRKLVRAPYVTPVRLVVGDLTIDGRTEDISVGGLLIICRQICPNEREGTLRFALPTGGKVVGVDARVRWVKAARADDPEGPRAIGVEFINPSAEVTASIAKYVSFMTVPEGDT